MPEVFVTNFNRNFTGVSATAANVVRAQSGTYDLALVGRPLPGCPEPISKRMALSQSKSAPDGRPFAIWHVRRNTEMRVAIWARDVLRCPVRIVFTSAAQRRHSAYPRWLISKMDAVIATTAKAAEFVPHVRAVVGHGVDTERFFPARNRAKSWADLGYGGTKGIATIGRIRPEKGTDVFVDAMIRLLPQRPDTVALVIGRAGGKHDRFLDELKSRVAVAGLSDRILFPGEICADKLPGVLRSLSLVCQLPRYEGFGMVPLEAMASGTPFIGSDAGDYRRFASDETVGRIVEIEDAGAAAAQAHEMLDDPAYARIAGQARALCETRFSAAQEAVGIDAVYQELWAK